MAFWGVEVKPGKPFIHSYDTSRGRLRLSQATLGNGTATGRSVLQCNVGKKSPVLLCALLPNRTESCCLDLHFAEAVAITFSVVGPRSIHLAGYFNDRSNDSDSYGEDIWDTEGEESGDRGSEDKYESDFIDDGDIEMSPSSRCHTGDAVFEDIIEDKKPVNVNHTFRRLRKKHQVSDSDEGDVNSQRPIVLKHSKSHVSESEEEDGFPISFSISNKDKEKNVDGKEKLDGKILDGDVKGKLHVTVQDKGTEREGEADAVIIEKPKKKKRKDKAKLAKSPEADNDIPGEKSGNRPGEDQNGYSDGKRDETHCCGGEHEKLHHGDHVHEMVVTENSGKLRKRKKERSRKGGTYETEANLIVDQSEGGASTVIIVAASNVEQTNIGKCEKDLLVRGRDQGISDVKETIASSATPNNVDKPKRKKKKTKDKSALDKEHRSTETLPKDGNEQSQSMEVVTSKPSKLQEKTGNDKPVSELPLKMCTSIGEEHVPADLDHKPSKKKQKKEST